MIASVSGTEVQRRDRMHKRMYSVARDQIMLGMSSAANEGTQCEYGDLSVKLYKG
jgi:hypothetical protein